MNTFSCGLSCTWMPIIDCIFMLLTAYLEMFHWSILRSCLLLGCITNFPNRKLKLTHELMMLIEFTLGKLEVLVVVLIDANRIDNYI